MDDVPAPDASLRLRPPTAGRGSVMLVGTAHISHDSVAEVEETSEAEQPDVIAVELDDTMRRGRTVGWSGRPAAQAARVS